MILIIVNKVDVMTSGHIVKIFASIFEITFLLGISAAIISVTILFISLFQKSKISTCYNREIEWI